MLYLIEAIVAVEITYFDFILNKWIAVWRTPTKISTFSQLTFKFAGRLCVIVEQSHLWEKLIVESTFPLVYWQLPQGFLRRQLDRNDINLSEIANPELNCS